VSGSPKVPVGVPNTNTGRQCVGTGGLMEPAPSFFQKSFLIVIFAKVPTPQNSSLPNVPTASLVTEAQPSDELRHLCRRR